MMDVVILCVAIVLVSAVLVLAEQRLTRRRRSLTYLAIPYSHPNAFVRHNRFVIANKAAGLLTLNGHIVFSPISHSHPIAEVCDLPKSWDYWERVDRAYLEASKLLIVLMIDGWEESKGVQAEIAIAKQLRLPIEYMVFKEGPAPEVRHVN